MEAVLLNKLLEGQQETNNLLKELVAFNRKKQNRKAEIKEERSVFAEPGFADKLNAILPDLFTVTNWRTDRLATNAEIYFAVEKKLDRKLNAAEKITVGRYLGANMFQNGKSYKGGRTVRGWFLKINE